MMSKLYKLSGIAVFLTLSGLLPVFGGRVEVAPTGETSTIREGLIRAAPFDTLVIQDGYYPERGLLVDKPLHIIGVGHPVIDGQMSGEILTITADHVLVEGLTLKDVGTSYIEDRAAIRVRRARQFNIRNNRIINSFFGIYLEKAKDGIVAGNTVIGDAVEEMSSGNAIHLWYCNNITVEDNDVSGHRDGIYLEFVNNSYIGCNMSTRHLRYGLHFMFSNDDVYVQNTFRHNGAGVAVMFSRRIRMEENTFIENWGTAAYGMLLKEIFDARILDNRFERNTTAIFVEGSNRIEYRDNIFLHNGWALKISGGCEDNLLTGNGFIANSFDLATQSSARGTEIHGNYWSDYSGYDLDQDGVGDIPHRPVKLFNYIVNKSPEAVILLRSMFVDLVNYAERVSPVFTPVHIADDAPLMEFNILPYDPD